MYGKVNGNSNGVVGSPVSLILVKVKRELRIEVVSVTKPTVLCDSRDLMIEKRVLFPSLS